ncbi:MAG: alpha/beta fold hydrolase [Alphaproteobacteria bacterium]|nr:alpha/beta fold hydrolase [Alphaproteobacteria bacterium]
MQIKANGISLEYEEYGPKDGPPLILIRGLGSQLVYWPQELVQGFASAGYRTITFDNRDVGLSQRFARKGVTDSKASILARAAGGDLPKPAYTLDDMARDVVGLIDALNIPHAHIFGISMGGGIAQLLAINHADRLLSASIVMTTAKFRGPEMLEILLVEDEDRATFQESWIAGNMDYGSPGFRAPDSYIRAEAGQAWDRGADAAGVNRQTLATMASSDRREMLKAVNLPCLVIHGAVDTLIPPEAGREIAALIPQAELEIIDGMGHVITPLLGPVIVGLLDRFIRR